MSEHVQEGLLALLRAVDLVVMFHVSPIVLQRVVLSVHGGQYTVDECLIMR